MKIKSISTLILLVLAFGFSAQELNVNVIVDYSQVQNSNVSVYKDLETSLERYINNTKWTEEEYKPNEKIECTFVILINNRPQINTFNSSLQILSKRPVHNSSYSTPLMNWQDADFTFEYIQNEQFFFNERRFSNKNLIDVFAFYIYIILGLDADSFSELGGNKYFEKAREISVNGESQNTFSGWKRLNGPRNRGGIIYNILLKDMEELRKINYEYHFKGLDRMPIDQKEAKTNIYNSIMKLDKYKSKVGQYFGLDVFVNAKKDEILKIFSSGPAIDLPIDKLKKILVEINPANAKKWNELKD